MQARPLSCSAKSQNPTTMSRPTGRWEGSVTPAGGASGPELSGACTGAGAGVTEPSALPKNTGMVVGFCDFAEQLNGRACMVGFVAMFLVEGAYGFFNPHGGLFQLLGVSVGNGLGFEL